MRGTSSWWPTGLAALLLVTVPMLAGCQDRTDAPAPTPLSASSGASHASASERDVLRAELAADPAVVREMLFRPQPRGTMLCGIRVFGRDGDRIYAWVLCEDFRVGSHATALSGTSVPAVLTVSGRGSAIRLTAAAFPRQATLAADIDRMFPPRIARLMLRGTVLTTPDEQGLLAEARQLG